MIFSALRYLDVVSVDHEGQQMFCLHDPEGYVEHQVLVSPLALCVATLLDGERDSAGVREAFRELSGGGEITEERIEEVVAFLDDHGFLDSDTFRSLRADSLAKYAASRTRPAYLSGKAYPEDGAALRAYIDSFFHREDGPQESPAVAQDGDECVRGIVVPHIDFERGGHSYAHGFLQVTKKSRPKIALVFGVAHASPPVPFVLTRKDFETPFGTLACDVDLVERLAAACEFDPFEYEIVHRTEHSVEFQAVMLAYLYGTNVKIVPVLCGPFDLDGSDGPTESDTIQRFLAVCQDIVREGEGTVIVIAGADLAHVGKRFGDDHDIDEAIVDAVAERDRADLTHVLAPDADKWYASVMRDSNARRVCGINCIYSALKSLDGTVRSGELLHYGYAPDPAGGIVSFAGITLS